MLLDTGSWFQDVFAGLENDFVGAATVSWLPVPTKSVHGFAGFIGRLQTSQR
jgi:hypothetical protein